jgi:serine protease
MRSVLAVMVFIACNLFVHEAAAQPPVIPGSDTVPWHAVPQPERSLENSPVPDYFIKPGISGIYSKLRTGAGDRTVARRLVPYQSYATPATPSDPSKYNIRQIVVKFVEGSAIRLRNGALAVSSEPEAIKTRARLSRAGLEPQTVEVQLATFNKLVATLGATEGRASPQVEELDLMRLRQRAELTTGLEQPDLNLFYFVLLKKISPERAQAALLDFRKLRIVETAYFQPIPFDAADIPPITTIDVTNSQGYFRPAPTGVDVNFARLFAGGRGEGVRIADIEAGWTTDHEDFPQMGFGIGTNWGSDHGTAVLGEIVAEDNHFGATGIASNSLIGWSSVTNLNPFSAGGIYFYSVANALLATGSVLMPGDIALIEQHYPNLLAGPCPNTCNCGQFGYVAVETLPFEHAAISMATGAGVIVVEAAGNGQTLVTPASTRDSGAIIVGASDSGGAGVPACFTNFGPRVNVRSWGNSIGSTGYGDDPSLRANGGDSRQWYTRVFGGTSGASPIVVGVAAIIQGTRNAVGLARLTPIEMRTLLVSTGIPQSTGVAIGPQPNLRAAIATYIPDMAHFVRQTAVPNTVSPGANFGVTVTFQNSGGIPWQGGHTMAIARGSGAVVWPSLSLALGSSTSPVMPADQVSKAFSITAPMQPGTYGLSFVVKNPGGQDLAFSPQQTIVVAAPNTQFDNASVTLTVPGSLQSGAQAQATVTATNTGTTTWSPGYGLMLSRTGRVALPSNFVSLTGSVAPGQSVTLGFAIVCNSQGLGGVSVQMSSSISGRFGQSVGQNVVCQP